MRGAVELGHVERNGGVLPEAGEVDAERLAIFRAVDGRRGRPARVVSVQILPLQKSP